MGSITDFLPAQILTVLLRGNLRQQLSVSQYFYRDPPLRMVAVPCPSGDQAIARHI
jgi:hypothetical protein